MRKLMETVKPLTEAAPAFELGVNVYALYDPNEDKFGVVDMGEPKLSPVPRKSTLSNSKEGCERKKQLIIDNIKRNMAEYSRMKNEFQRRIKVVNKWIVVEISVVEA